MRNKTKKKTKTEQKKGIGDYILDALNTKTCVFQSWAPDNIRKLDDGLEFSVSGFLHTGKVRILYNEGMDDFTVFIMKDDEIIDRTDFVYVDELMNLVDSKVECNVSPDEYRKMVMDAYNIT